MTFALRGRGLPKVGLNEGRLRGFVTDKEDEDPAKSRNLSRRHMCTAPSLLSPAAIPGEIGRSLPPPLSLSRKVPRDGDGEDCGKLGVEVYLWLASRRKCWLAATEVFPR